MSVIKDGSVVVSLEEFDRLRECDAFLKELDGKNYIRFYGNNNSSRYWFEPKPAISLKLEDFPEIKKQIDHQLGVIEKDYENKLSRYRNDNTELEKTRDYYLNIINEFKDSSLIKRLIRAFFNTI